MANFFSDLRQAYLIAEIGVNHNGDVQLAKKMIDAAKFVGADAVKFQTFSASSLVGNGTPKVAYQEITTSPDETHYEMIHRLELSYEAHRELKLYCDNSEIEFLSTPYDIESARFLNELGVRFFKTASADLVDLPLQKYIASTGKPAIIATGMATLGEIERVVNLYENLGHQNIILLHCVSNYPCSDASLNMRAMKTLGKAFGLPIGYSDHSVGSLAATISVAMGAKVIEKHFTLDKNMPGPDHRASSTPEEFLELVKEVRRSEKMLGSPRKLCQDEEKQMASVSRKSIVLARNMSAGEVISVNDLALKRPGTGIDSSNLHKIVGKKIRMDGNQGSQLTWSDVE
jgi:N-acetylneuraminate synthase